MKRLSQLLLVALLCLPVLCHAQKGKGMKILAESGSKSLLRDAAGQALTETGADMLTQNITRHILSEQLARQYAQYAVLKMESAKFNSIPEHKKYLVQANAFLVEMDYKGKKEIWGVTTSEMMDGYGKDLVLKTQVNGKEISIPATIVQKGPYALSNISLLRVPQQLPNGLKPLKLPAQYDKTKPVGIFGYDKGKWYEIPSLTLQKDNGLFLRMDFSSVSSPSIGALGAPVLSSDGSLIGVFCGASWTGGYASSTRMLPNLVEAEHGGSQEIPFVMRDVFFGNIRLTEVILSIEALDANGKVRERVIFPKEIHQSTIFHLLEKKKTRFLRFLLEDRHNNPHSLEPGNTARWLIYDKTTQRHFFIDE